jgi:hypothetical protein
VASPNPVAKSRSVVAGMLAGADNIDDLDLLRAGATARVVGGVRAPSTLGTFLRSFTHGHVQQIDQIAAGVLAGLTGQVPGLLAGGRDAGASCSSTSTTRSAPSTGTRSRRLGSGTPGCGA